MGAMIVDCSSKSQLPHNVRAPKGKPSKVSPGIVCFLQNDQQKHSQDLQNVIEQKEQLIEQLQNELVDMQQQLKAARDKIEERDARHKQVI